MKAPDIVDTVQTGLALAELGRSVANGEVPDARAIVTAVSSVLVTLASLDDLHTALEDAARRRQDSLAELAGVAKLGPRP